jgi:hypothetical protein
VRHSFLRKVLGLLTVQIAITAAIGSAVIFSKPVRHYIYHNDWVRGTAQGTAAGQGSRAAAPSTQRASGTHTRPIRRNSPPRARGRPAACCPCIMAARGR